MKILTFDKCSIIQVESYIRLYSDYNYVIRICVTNYLWILDLTFFTNYMFIHNIIYDL